MRRWLLLVMVLLLPLRGWVGEAMAGQMAQHHTAPAAMHATAPAQQPVHVHAVQDGHGHDCDEHAHAALAPDEAATTQAPDDCAPCASCQVCSSVALSAPVAVSTPAAFSHPQPQAVQFAYASAEPGLFFKPPRR